MSDLNIVLFHYKPNPEKPGYSSLERSATLNEIKSQFTKVLEATPLGNDGTNAEQHAEWIYNHDEKIGGELRGDDPVTDLMVTQARLNVMFRPGGSEGYLIDLVLLNTLKETYKPLVTAKWLSDQNGGLWEVMKALTNAIDAGNYV